MTKITAYKCNACGYTAEVLDQPETDMYYTVGTKHCQGCKSLVTVAIKAHAASMIGGEYEGASHEYRYVDECPDCSSKNTQDWDASHPCPKCGECMTEEAA